jgi:hypothetical protein
MSGRRTDRRRGAVGANRSYASIAVTAHTYAGLFDDELDNIAVALDSLSDF